jgi:hypothetical protein
MTATQQWLRTLDIHWAATSLSSAVKHPAVTTSVCLIALLLDPEDESSMFHRNIGNMSLDFMVQYPRRLSNLKLG